MIMRAKMVNEEYAFDDEIPKSESDFYEGGEKKAMKLQTLALIRMTKLVYTFLDDELKDDNSYVYSDEASKIEKELQDLGFKSRGKAQKLAFVAASMLDEGKSWEYISEYITKEIKKYFS